MLTKFELYQPAAIDNSLNSYQIIHKLIHEMNLIIDEVNNIDSKANEYTDEQIRALRTELVIRFDAIEHDLTVLSGRVDLTESDISALNRAVSDLRQTVIDNYTTLDNKIDYEKSELLEQIAYNYNTLLHYIDSKIDVVLQLIESITGIKVYGLNGRVTNIQDALNQIVASLNMSRQFLTYYDLKTYVNNDASFYDSSAIPVINVRIGDITYKDLIDGLTRLATSSIYLTKYMGVSVENEVLHCDFLNCCRRPLSSTIGFLACALAQHISSSTTYYTTCKAVTQRFVATGIGYNTVLYDYSGRYY